MDALLRRRQMMLAGGSPTPPEHSLVFYDRLVFDGTAYIDTDIVPGADYSYRLAAGNEAQKKAQRYFFVPTEGAGFVGLMLNSSTTSTSRVFSVFYGSTSSLSNNQTLSFSTYPTTALWLTPKRFGWGSTPHSITKGNLLPNGPLVIGQSSSHSGQPYTGRLGWFRIYGSDAQNCASNSDFDSFTPVYTLRPCTYDGEAGMWCVELQKFYGNTAGAGTLTVLNNS